MSSIFAFIAGASMVSGVIPGVLTLTVLHDEGLMKMTMTTSPGTMMGGGGSSMMTSDSSFMWAAIIGGVTAAVSAGIGAVCIVGGYAIYRNPKNKTKWGIAILIPSFVGAFILSGFIIGPILGVVAGLLALARPSKWGSLPSKFSQYRDTDMF